MTTPLMARRGFTLIELILSLIVSAIVGAALVRMVTSQARFMDQQEAWRSARSVARGGINRLLSDLRMVAAGAGGVTQAVAGGQDFTVRVPYAFGVVCNLPSTSTVVAAMLPVDAQMFNAGGHTGFAVRQTANGLYTYYTSNPAPATATAAEVLMCTAPGGTDKPITTGITVNGSPAGVTLKLSNAGGVALNPVPKKGEILFLYRTIRYQFKNSTALAGRTGLFRTTVTNNQEEELATPFANTARVNFYNLNNVPAQAAVPTLADIRGFELVLDGMSERTPSGSAAPKTANVRTSVFFGNRPD